MSEYTCVHCEDLDNVEYEYDAPEAPHHGATGECGECNAQYYQVWGGTIYAANEQAKFNHPELKSI